ncbi:hypothetical protein D3C87_734140 [compost metagenome]
MELLVITESSLDPLSGLGSSVDRYGCWAFTADCIRNLILIMALVHIPVQISHSTFCNNLLNFSFFSFTLYVT